MVLRLCLDGHAPPSRSYPEALLTIRVTHRKLTLRKLENDHECWMLVPLSSREVQQDLERFVGVNFMIGCVAYADGEARSGSSEPVIPPFASASQLRGRPVRRLPS